MRGLSNQVANIMPPRTHACMRTRYSPPSISSIQARMHAHHRRNFTSSKVTISVTLAGLALLRNF